MDCPENNFKVEIAEPLTLPLKLVSGDEFTAMVDSGASCNMVSERFVSKHQLWDFTKPINKIAITASGDILKIIGILSVRSRIGIRRNHTFKFISYIVSGINKDCYLGLPFIKKYKHLIPFEKVNIKKTGEEISPEQIEAITKLNDEPRSDQVEAHLIDRIQYLRLLKNNEGGILLVQNKPNDQDSKVNIQTVMVDVPLTGMECNRERILQRYSKTVTNEEPKNLPPRRTIDHRITLLEEKKPIHRNQYRLSFEERVELDKQVNQLLAKGFIRPSESPFNAPVLFVKKKDGTLRLCTDFRLLNEATVKDRFPLPRIDEILDVVGNAKVFSKLDLLSGYFQVRIQQEDISKTAFSTNTGHFEWVVMPFGLSNAPATFQRFMNRVLQPFLGKFVMVYLDDIVIYSDSVLEHEKHLQMVLDTLKENSLVAKRSKCAFFYSQISFLGFIIGGGKVLTDPEKIIKVKNWPRPKTVKDCQSFVGLTGFYRRFIKNYAKITAPLQDFITGKTKWAEPQDESFQTIKDKMVSTPVLQAPIFKEGYKFRVTTDASDTCLGFVLEQLDDKGKLLGVIQYGSKKLVGAELNYPVREKEFYAVITALKKFRSYLMYRRFLICTDHHSLIYLKQQKQVNSGRLARWLDFLSQFEFDIQYIRGKTNSAADALSRYPDIPMIETLSVTGSETRMSMNEDLKRKIVEGYPSDEEFGHIYEILLHRRETPPDLHHHIQHFTIDEGLLLYRATKGEEFVRICIPAQGTLRKDLIGQCHDGPTAGHFGAFKTYEMLARSFYWNRMIKTVKRYVATCDVCQRSKPTNVATQGLFKPLPVPIGRWTDITLDFVGALPKTRTGFDTIMVVVDRLSKRAHFIPTRKTLKASGAAALFMDHIFRLHGVPRRIVSDKDIRFTAKFWRTVHAQLGTSILFSTTNHPQTDGQSERTIRTLIQYLRAFCKRDVLNWDKFLFAAEFSYNSTYHDGIKDVPFRVDLGYIPDSPSYVSTTNVLRWNNSADEFVKELRAILLSTQDQMVDTQAQTERQVNKHRSQAPYKVGDLVLVHKDALIHASSTTYMKLHPAYLGPYRLVKKLNDNAFEVDLPSHVKKHRTINVQWFKPYNERDEAYPKQPPELDGDIMARLTEITGIAGFDYAKREAYVFWRDCPPGASSAITYEQFDSIPVALRTSLIEEARSIGAGREDTSKALGGANVTDPIQEDDPAPLDDDPGIDKPALDHDNSESPEDR